MSQAEQALLDEVYSEEQVAATEETTEVVETEETDTAEEPVKTETVEDSTTESKTDEPEQKETEKKEWTFSQAMDEREKRQKWEERALAAEAKLEKPADDISVFDDETGSKDQERHRTDEAIRNNSLNMSQAFAEEVFGEEKVTEALEWMKAEGVKSAYVVNEFNNAKLPFHKMVKMHEDEQARQNPEATRAAMRAEILEEIASENKAESEKAEKKTSIKPSLASERSTGAENTATESFSDMLQD